MTSQRLAEIMRTAERRWFLTALRRRLDDGDRMRWKERYVARAVTLLQRWAARGGA